MTTFGDQVYQYGGVPVGAGPLSMAGKAYFVRPGTGSDANAGLKPTNALALLSAAQSKMTADAGQVVYLISEDNSASGTTNRVEGATFTWSKDGTHIQGVSSGSLFGSRA